MRAERSAGWRNFCLRNAGVFFTPARVYRDDVNKEMTIDLEKYVQELLGVNPAANLRDFIEYLTMIDDELPM